MEELESSFESTYPDEGPVSPEWATAVQRRIAERFAHCEVVRLPSAVIFMAQYFGGEGLYAFVLTGRRLEKTGDVAVRLTAEVDEALFDAFWMLAKRWDDD